MERKLDVKVKKLRLSRSKKKVEGYGLKLKTLKSLKSTLTNNSQKDKGKRLSGSVRLFNGLNPRNHTKLRIIESTRRFNKLMQKMIKRRREGLIPDIRDFIIKQIQILSFIISLDEFMNEKIKALKSCFVTSIAKLNVFQLLATPKNIHFSYSNRLSENTAKFNTSRRQSIENEACIYKEHSLYKIKQFLERKQQETVFNTISCFDRLSISKNEYVQPNSMRDRSLCFLLNLINVFVRNRKNKYLHLFVFNLKKIYTKKKLRQIPIIIKPNKTAKIAFIVLKKVFERSLKIGFNEIHRAKKPMKLKKFKVVYGVIKDLQKSLSPKRRLKKQQEQKKKRMGELISVSR